jgi:predicted nucleotidyltransferase
MSAELDADTLVAEELARGVVAALGARVVCVVLTGSCARREAVVDSDLDLWVVVGDIVDETVLNAVAQVSAAARSQTKREVNAQCASTSELANRAYRQRFSSIQLHVDGRILYGAPPGPLPSREAILDEAQKLAAEVVMSARHYIVGAESESSLARGKLSRLVLKPLTWALRYMVLARDGQYPRTIEDLAGALHGEALESVQIFMALRSSVFDGPYGAAVVLAERVACSILQQSRQLSDS